MFFFVVSTSRQRTNLVNERDIYAAVEPDAQFFGIVLHMRVSRFLHFLKRKRLILHMYIVECTLYIVQACMVHVSFNFKMEKRQQNATKKIENKCFNFCQTEKEAIRQKIYGVPVNGNGF